jgi:hypothetical protein
VEDARKRVFPLKVEVLPEHIMLNMAISSETDKEKCSSTEMLMSAVTIITPSGPLCMRSVRQIIVEEDMDHSLIGRPVLDEMGFVASQRLDSVRVKFHVHNFSRIGETLFNMDKQTLSSLSKLLLNPADNPEFIEDSPDALPLAKGTNIKKREQIKPSVLDQDKCGVKRGEDDGRYYEVLQLNVKFTSIQEQSLFYRDIPDDDPIDYHDV